MTPEPRRSSLYLGTGGIPQDSDGAGLGAAWELGLIVTSPSAVHPGIGSRSLFTQPRNAEPWLRPHTLLHTGSLAVSILSHLINGVSFWEDTKSGGCTYASGIPLPPPCCVWQMASGYEHVCACGQRPKVNFRCFPQALYTFVFETVSFIWTWSSLIKPV